jgi:hypothetical protein
MKHACMLICALVVVAAAAVGCGSSPGDDAAPQAVVAQPAAAPAPRLGKAAYIRKADGLCRNMRRISRRLNKEYDRAVRARQPFAAAAAIDNYAPIYSAWLQQLTAVPLPKGDSALARVLLEILANQSATATAHSTALRNDQPVAVRQIRRARKEAVTTIADFGRRYGFKVCGSVL